MKHTPQEDKSELLATIKKIELDLMYNKKQSLHLKTYKQQPINF